MCYNDKGKFSAIQPEKCRFAPALEKDMKVTVKALCLLLCICTLISLASCSSSYLDGVFKRDENNPDQTTAPDDTPAVPDTLTRRAGKYSILVVNEGSSAGSLSALFICVIDPSGDGSAKFLQIPAATYVNGTYLTFAAQYSGSYNAALFDGCSSEMAREKAISAVRSLIVTNLCIPVDYYLCMTPDQLSGVAETFGGISADVPFTMALPGGGVLEPGRQDIKGSAVGDFATYSGFSAASAINVYKVIYASLITKARAVTSNDNIALLAAELRYNTTTDIPSSSGEDIFLIRKLITPESGDITFTDLAAQSCAIDIGVAYVIYRDTAYEQIKNYLEMYENNDFSSFFDKDGSMNKKSTQTINTIYTTKGETPAIYSVSQITEGIISLAA